MEFRLPELGEGVNEGELVKWKVKPGDKIADDQPLCEIMTDKATIEIPSPFSGIIGELHAKEGEIVKVHQILISLEKAGGATAANPAAAKNTSPAEPPMTESVDKAPVSISQNQAKAEIQAASSPRAAGSEVLASPSTRAFAREQGLDLANISGSGPHGRVLREDVEQAKSGGTGATAAGSPQAARSNRPIVNIQNSEERIAFRGLRKKIAEKMAISKAKAAHFTYVEEADATKLVALRKQAKALYEKQGIKITYLPFVMKAMVAALKKYPTLNSTLDEATNEIVVKHYYNIGLSVQTPDGLMAPVIKSVETKSILQIAKEIQDVVDRARQKKLTMDDLTGSTITLTNAGSIGGLFATPVINFPEVAILGLNKIARKPVVVTRKDKETIVIRDWTYFSISLDHRIIDGAIGAEFMKSFIQYIENPSLLVLE